MAPRADLPRRPIVRRRGSIWALLALALVTWLLQRSGVLVLPDVRRPSSGSRPPVAREELPEDSAPSEANARAGSASHRDENATADAADEDREPSEIPGERWPDRALAEGAHRVERVVDGDTLVVERGARIRLIGVNTPETV